jgi:hypothetical protein
MCLGYVAGVSDALEEVNQICPPKGVNVRQIIDLIVKYLSDHPEKRHYDAASEAGLALMDAFPCK